MCEVSTPQWPSAQISLFSKTHQSAWCGSVMIAKSPGNHDSPSDALLMSRFQNFAAAASQKTWEFERRSRGWINNSRPIILICCLLHYVCVTWLIRMCDMTHSYVWCDLRVTWLPHVCNMTHPCVWNSNVWHETESCVTFLCEVTHSYVWHHLFTRVTWLIHMWHMTICMCDMAHSHVGCMYMCDLTHVYVWLDFLCRALRVEFLFFWFEFSRLLHLWVKERTHNPLDDHFNDNDRKQEFIYWDFVYFS